VHLICGIGRRDDLRPLKLQIHAAGSTDPGHQGEIEVLSWSHGFVQPAPIGQPQTSHSRLSLTKYLDVATNTLQKYSWSGKQIGKATITCFRSDGASGNQSMMCLTIVLEHVINYSISGGPGDIPVENITPPRNPRHVTSHLR
jgi:type VI secretion system secreted protein Hcp